MARKVRDATLDSKDARRKLKSRGKPYYRAIERGLHLGYRKLANGAAGTWVARHYVGDQSYQVEKIGIADDLSDADGVAVLGFWQAQTKARERMVGRVHAAAGKTGPLTVAAAMDAYLEFLESNRKSADDARYRDRAFVRPKLGELEVAALTAGQIRKWLADLAKAPPRLRTREGEKQKHRLLGTDDEAKRRRQATANRTLTVLKAALNMAWREHPKAVPSNGEWRRVEPFENVEAARIRYLSVVEAKRLINGCDPDFRKLVQGGLQTGARYGELAALQVHDFNPDAGTITIRQSKGGKARHVKLTKDEGVPFFKQVCAGRAGNEIMFPKASGGPWLKSHQKRPMAEACERAKIKPPIGFHGLRHTWASLAVMDGTPLMVVAKNLGHSDTRMVEKHYGHLAPSYIDDAIQAGAPRFGFRPDKKLATLASGR
jgi:integrase